MNVGPHKLAQSMVLNGNFHPAFTCKLRRSKLKDTRNQVYQDSVCTIEVIEQYIHITGPGTYLTSPISLHLTDFRNILVALVHIPWIF